MSGDLGIGERRFAVTGATGWLGRGVLEVLADDLGPAAFGRQVTGFASRPRTLSLSDGTTTDVLALSDLPEHPHDVLVHMGFVTREHVTTLGLDRWVTENIKIATRVLAAVEAQLPEVVCYASSGAVYGRLGTGDLAADPYGELKRLDERALRGAAAEIGGRLVVSRVFNVAGPWISKPGFAIANMILQAQAGGPLRIQARGPVTRAYIDVTDYASVLIASACDPGSPPAILFDTSGEAVEMADLAARVIEVLGKPIEIERTFDPEAPADHYVGDPAGCDALFARYGLSRYSLDDQILRTAEYIALNLPA